ncbi:carboxypeptidase-like regulatory domain-containing protein [Aquimarina spinulae]|uniref:carboxypeptidase-like regulatory domain-containing protein n=1 Tax=Aquimarina spinulae TaxID=1192023 RepID=UPI000D5621CF|nr:carboxypeptidase-like regulatory domain-containing protein [Aquimarina spinulae]
MNKSCKFYFSIVFLLFSFIAFAQNNIITISGQILDKETKEPIVFASIYLKERAIGTTSNEEGGFNFHFPSYRNSNTIIISMIGYQSIEKSADDFIDNQKIFLTSEVTSLDEVVITSTKKKELTSKQIVKKAYKEIEKNYPTEPYILEGFVRDLQNEDGKYVEYLECAAKFYNKSHKIQTEPEVELVEIRRNYITTKNPWNKLWERKNSVIDLIEDDFIRFDYGPIKGKKGWKYEIESILPYNNRYVYKIKGIDKPFQKAILYIDTETYAFVRMELTRTAYNGKSWKRRLTSGEQQMHYNVVFEYQEYKGKMYLKYQKEEDTWQIFDMNEPNTLLFTKNPKKELFINKIVSEDIENYPFKKNMRIGSSLENQEKEYNPEFWATYNLPKQTEKGSKIVRELKKATTQ